MDQFYQFTILDHVTMKKIKGVIKGTDVLEMVRVLTQTYKNIDHIEMDRVGPGTILFVTESSHLRKEDSSDVQ